MKNEKSAICGHDEDDSSDRRTVLLNLAGMLGLAGTTGRAATLAGTGPTVPTAPAVHMERVGPLQLELRHLAPSGPSRAPVPVLLIPGAYHGAWAFERNLGPYFASRGYDTYLLSLRGHGASGGHDQVMAARFTDYLDDVLAVTSVLPDHPVLIGHSLGGLLAQRAAERAAPSALVLMATPTPRSMREGALQLLGRFPWPVLKFALTGDADHIYRDSTVVRGLLFGGVRDDMVDEAIQRITRERESARLIADVQSLELSPSRTPTLAIGGDADVGVPVDALREAALLHDGTFKVLPGAAHQFFMMPGWEVAATCIEQWLRGAVGRSSR